MPSKSSAPRWFRVALVLVGFLVSSSAFAVTIVVTSAADTLSFCSLYGFGECTLRDAIIYSNANPPAPNSSNLIQFNIPGSGVHTITLASDLPAITTATVIDGYSQPGASPNTLAVGDDAVLLIFLVGGFDVTTPLVVSGGTGSTIRGLVINTTFNFYLSPGQFSIRLLSCCNRIAGNFLGVDPTGSTRASGGIEVNSSRNAIGGPDPAERNVICEHSDHPTLVIRDDENGVDGNYIGTNAAGNTALGCGISGIVIEGSFNRIGGSVPPTRRNVISGIGSDAVTIFGSRNLVSGNFIGTDASGTAPIPNDNGVLVLYGAEQNVIGASPNSFIFGGNRIAFNNHIGVIVGDDGGHNPVFSRFNSILSNSIFSNGGLGICLGGYYFSGKCDGAGVAASNDPCDPDPGDNDAQNFPVLTSATVLKSNKPRSKAETEIQGTLNSAPSTTYRIQLFANSSCDPSGHGEGETFLDDVFVTADDNCNASFTADVPADDAPPGQFITATATDPAGNTSEFSACEQVVAPLIRPHIRLIEGPIRVAPGVPVEFGFKIDTEPPGQTGDFSGEVVVSDDQGDVCQADVSPAGEGTCPLTFGTPGNYRVRAHYLGNATFEENTSRPVPVLVGMPGGAP